jgi:hypothetical protein
MRKRRLCLLLGLLVLLVAPGCRTLASAATFVGAVVIEAALDGGDDDDGYCSEPEPRRDRRAPTPNPSRRASKAAPDPSR